MNGGANAKEKTEPFIQILSQSAGYYAPYFGRNVNHRYTTIPNPTIYYGYVYYIKTIRICMLEMSVRVAGEGYSSTHANTFVDNNTQFSFGNREWCISVSVYQ